MWSRSATLARPVRTPAISLRKSSTAFSIRNLACAIASLLLEIVLIASSPRLFRRYGGTYFFTHHRAANISRLVHIEDDDRHSVVHAQRNRGGIHHREALLNHVQIG